MIDFDYKCSMCATPTERELLTVKKVSFLEMGARPGTIKTRTESWLCPNCLKKDTAFNIPKGFAPGTESFDRK